MLLIRESQMRAFDAVSRQAFKAEMLAHLAQFSPPLFKAAGEAAMRGAIDLGFDRAAQHGFTLRGPIRLYLELMLLFGSHFDTDPQYPWAADILAHPEREPEMQRAERLYSLTMDYRRDVAGPADVHALDALARIAALARQPLPVREATLLADLLWQIRVVYPRKAAHCGDESLERLVTRAIDGAQRQGFDTARGAVLVTMLMLAFGHGCGADPLYPWIAATLRDPHLTDPPARQARLERKALTWLDHVLAHFSSAVPA